MTKHECDETCHGCPKCYLATGQTVCDKDCPHAIVEDELDLIESVERQMFEIGIGKQGDY